MRSMYRNQLCFSVQATNGGEMSKSTAFDGIKKPNAYVKIQLKILESSAVKTVSYKL